MMNGIGITDGYSTGSSANHVKPRRKSHLSLCDDPNGDWLDFILNGERTTKKVIACFLNRVEKILP